MDATDVAVAGGIFQRLGDLVVRWPLPVIGFWIALAAVLSLDFAAATVVAAQRQVEALPPTPRWWSPAEQMAEAFHETGSASMLLVVLTDEKGLGPADETTYRALVDKLRQDTQDVETVQDFLSTPPVREVLQSKDNKVWNLPIDLTVIWARHRPGRRTNTSVTWSRRPSRIHADRQRDRTRGHHRGLRTSVSEMCM